MTDTEQESLQQQQEQEQEQQEQEQQSENNIVSESENLLGDQEDGEKVQEIEREEGREESGESEEKVVAEEQEEILIEEETAPTEVADPVEEEPVEAEPVKEEPAVEEPVETEPVETEPVEEEPVEAEPAAEEPVETEPVETEPVEEEPVEAESVEAESVEAEPVAEEPVEAELAAEEPAEAEPVEAAPVEAESAAAEPTEGAPVETTPTGEAPVEEEPIEEAPVEEVPVATEPVAAEPAEEEPVAAEPVEAEPAAEAPVEEAPVEAESIKEVPVEKAPVETAPVETAPTDANENESIGSLSTLPEAILTVTSNDRKYPDLNDQSIDIGGGVRRRSCNPKALIQRRFEDISTVYHSFRRSAEKYQDNPCLGKRSQLPNGKAGPYEWMSYASVQAKSKQISAGFKHIGVPAEGHVGIFSQNRIEWQLVSIASNMQSLCTIALYDTLGPDSSLYIVDHGEIHTLCFAPEVTDRVVELATHAQNLKCVVIFDKEFPADAKAKCQEHNVACYTLDEVAKLGKENPTSDVPPKADSLCTIMYTSGTTGMPKGVMLTHRNIIAAISGVAHQVHTLSQGEISLISYLPLAHILERVAEELFLQEGGTIGYWQGDVLKLKDDIVTLKPTLMPAVPRVLDRFYDLLKSTVEAKSSLAKTIFRTGFNAKQSAQARKAQTPIWDAILFRKIKAHVGGRMRGILCGSAPLRPEVQRFLSVAFDCYIFQGYGLTETTAAATIQIPEDRTLSHIGCPLPCNEIKLVDVPELNYLSTNQHPQGEVCIRGPNVALGYYKEEEKTREVFDADGWFHTGDVGQWNPNGTLSIIDRIKNIFKLSQGEYVASEKVEQQLGSCEFVSQLWIYGDSFKSFVVGVVVVEPTSILRFAKSIGLPNTADKVTEVITDERVVKEVLSTITKRAREAGLKGFEIPKAVHLVDKEFGDFGCVTPSMKLQRSKLKEVFQEQIDRMYSSNTK